MNDYHSICISATHGSPRGEIARARAPQDAATVLRAQKSYAGEAGSLSIERDELLRTRARSGGRDEGVGDAEAIDAVTFQRKRDVVGCFDAKFERLEEAIERGRHGLAREAVRSLEDDLATDEA